MSSKRKREEEVGVSVETSSRRGSFLRSSVAVVEKDLHGTARYIRDGVPLARFSARVLFEEGHEVRANGSKEGHMCRKLSRLVLYLLKNSKSCKPNA